MYDGLVMKPVATKPSASRARVVADRLAQPRGVGQRVELVRARVRPRGVRVQLARDGLERADRGLLAGVVLVVADARGGLRSAPTSTSSPSRKRRKSSRPRSAITVAHGVLVGRDPLAAELEFESADVLGEQPVPPTRSRASSTTTSAPSRGQPRGARRAPRRPHR